MDWDKGSGYTITYGEDAYKAIYDKYPDFDSLVWETVHKDNVIDFAAEKAKRKTK